MSKTENTVTIEIAPGELVDKLTILEIKKVEIDDPIKNKNVCIELDVLTEFYTEQVPQSDTLAQLKSQLKAINEALWKIEDDIRDCERNDDFSQTFIDLARAVYRTNDQRADVKKQINTLLGSTIVEEKSYADYGAS